MGRFVAVALVAIVALVGVAIVGTPAEAVSCVGAGDVTLLGSGGCTQGGLNLTDLSVAGFPSAKVLLGSLTTTIGQDVTLNFQVVHDPSPVSLADILFSYTVTAGPTGAPTGSDLFNPGQNVITREVACGEAFVDRVCATLPLANLVAVANATAARSFDPDSMVFIRKDIQSLNSAFISEFTESHDTTTGVSLTPVPRPAMLVLLGSTLAGLGMVSRRKLRNKHPQASA